MASALHRARAVVVLVEDETVRCIGCRNRTGRARAVDLGDAFACPRCADRRTVLAPASGRGLVEIVG